MSTPAVELPSEPVKSNPLREFMSAHWTEQATRLTAVLAVLAAVASSQYSLQISRAILAQAEATDEWNHHSAKSIKKSLTINQYELLSALALANPQLKESLGPLIKETESESQRYDKESKEIRQKAYGIDREKRRHQKKGDRFQYAFVMLQAGVVLCTVAASSKKRSLWLLAALLGVLGLLVLGDAYVLIV